MEKSFTEYLLNQRKNGDEEYNGVSHSLECSVGKYLGK